jgi:hypothetical protein
VKAATRRVVGPGAEERGGWRARPPRERVEDVPLETAQAGMLLVGNRLPRTEDESKPQQAPPGQRPLIQGFPAGVEVHGTARTRAERRSDQQVVPDRGPIALRDHGVERVPGVEVNQIDPCPEDLERSKLAAVLVRNDVVRIVLARAVVPEGSDRATRRRHHGHRAIGPIRASMRLPENLVDVVLAHATGFA